MKPYFRFIVVKLLKYINVNTVLSFIRIVRDVLLLYSWCWNFWFCYHRAVRLLQVYVVILIVYPALKW